MSVTKSPELLCQSTATTMNTTTLGTVKLIGGLIVRVLCVGSGGKPGPSSRSGGGRGNPGDLVPDGEAVGHLVAPSGGRQQMPPRTEMWRDAAERGQEPLRMPGRGEPFHRPLALPGRLMRVLGPVEFSTDVKCCDDSGGRFMLGAERAMPWSAWRLLSWHARSARCVVGVCGG